jgi:hypothetical protein
MMSAAEDYAMIKANVLRLIVLAVSLLAMSWQAAHGQDVERHCQYWQSVDLQRWSVDMDQIYAAYKAVRVTDDELEAAWLMDFEMKKAGWDDEDVALRNTRPRHLLERDIRSEKYYVRHSRRLTDTELGMLRDVTPWHRNDNLDRMREFTNDLDFTLGMAEHSACRCDCTGPIMRRICAFGIGYRYDLQNTYVPNHEITLPCFDSGLLPREDLERPDG